MKPNSAQVKGKEAASFRVQNGRLSRTARLISVVICLFDGAFVSSLLASSFKWNLV